MDKAWAELSWEEKRAKRFERWLSPPGVTFANAQAEKVYKERVTRFIKAFTLEKPDRVPCIIPTGFYAAAYAGTNLGEVMYDYDKMKMAWRKLLHEMDADTYVPPALVPPGRALDIMDYKLYKWPGHGLSKTTLSYQAVEGEWMKPDEYDALIRDPSDFWLRTYLPRIFGAFKAFSGLPPWTSFEEIATATFLPFGNPEIQAGFKALMEAGNETMKWIMAVGEVAAESLAMGYPGIMSGLAKAPFDTLGDTLRGTQGVMMDMFQRPQKVHEAMERIAPIAIAGTIASVANATAPTIIMPLHKGADSFMSPKQYETFYWPTFRKVVMAFINEGIFPILFAEGSYNNRLDIIGDFPKGSVAWYFDQTNIFEAKKKIGDKLCIVGNVPTSLIMTGTPQQVKEHCKKLIDGCAPGSGYVLAGGANVDDGNPENLRAMMAAVKEYGVYK
ncbi:MAG: uroporphyrinogen decarboxylase family protein [Dehalococcoidales bacterium]|nr:uroporphyrinogen decarboxylase family protein [Dehalococcoidales bacterium]